MILVPHCGFAAFVFYFHLFSDSYFIFIFLSLSRTNAAEEESTNLFLFYLVVLFVIKFSFLFYLRGAQNGKRYIKSFYETKRKLKEFMTTLLFLVRHANEGELHLLLSLSLLSFLQPSRLNQVAVDFIFFHSFVSFS